MRGQWSAGTLLETMKRLDGKTGGLQEVRIRCGKPILLYKDGREWSLDEKGHLYAYETEPRTEHRTENRREYRTERGIEYEAIVGDAELIRELLAIFSRHSLYAYEDEIRQGFLTVEGGHRVGISGRVVLEHQGIRTIKDISGLNIRLAHEYPGCADGVLPWMYENQNVVSTLFLSPPGAGKTTMLRDAIRQISNGTVYGAGVTVSVVDERSELGACYHGIPQCDLGMRTDVMDGCPKAAGMLMMIRSMAPRVVAVDEIGTREDLEALRSVMKCGCQILATVHGTSVEDLRKKPVLSEMVQEQMFSRYVVLSAVPKPGTVIGIYDEQLQEHNKKPI